MTMRTRPQAAVARGLTLALHDRTFTRWAVMFVALNLADMVTTYAALMAGSRHEAQPLFAYLFARYPFALALGVKLAFTAAWLAWSVFVLVRWRALALITTVIFCAILAWVVAANLGLLPQLPYAG